MQRPSANRTLTATCRAARLVLLACGGLGAAGVSLAQDATVADLTQPRSNYEIGAGDTSSGSFKAHEYDGLTRKGGFAIGNFDLRGGGSYDSDDASRWHIFGKDLGTESLTLGAESSVQGKGRFSITYSQLQHNIDDTYQTPLLGVGTNVLTLPSNWLVPTVPRVSSSTVNARGLSPAVTSSSAIVSGALVAPTAAQLATAAGIQAADLADFHSVNLSTKRTKIDFAAQVNLDHRWDVVLDMKHENRNGLQALGALSAFNGSDLSTIIPNLIDQDQDQLTLGFNYVGDRLVVQTAYNGSFLTNNVPSMTWQTWSVPTNSQTISSPPSNQMHLLSVQATYRLSGTTRLAGGLSYGRNTQNQAYVTDSTMPLVPVASLQGLVVNTSANLKLTARPARGLDVSAAYKFDERDNRTPVNIYGYDDAGTPLSGASPFAAYFPGVTLGSGVNINANRPYSKRINDLDLEGDYAVTRNQTVRGELEDQHIDHWCNNTWIACADADHSNEATLHLDWILRGDDKFSGRAGYAHSVRTVDYNEDAFLALVPMANYTPAGAPAGSTAYNTLTSLGYTGYGPVMGLNPQPAAGSAAAFYFPANGALNNTEYANVNRISELPGMRRYNMADRTRDKLRSSGTWQVAENFSLQLGLDYNRDEYTESVYGLQNAHSYAVNVDGSYAPGENLSVTGFVTVEDQRSQAAGNSYNTNSTATSVSGATAISGGCFATIAARNANYKTDPCLNWFSDTDDLVSTVGINAIRKNLMAGRLDLSGGLSFMTARTSDNVSGGSYSNNPYAVTGAPAGTVAAYYIPASALPVVTTKTVELRVGGLYRIDKRHSVRLGYMYQHMTSNDYAYQGLQPGGLSSVLPTFQQSASYNVNTVTAAYVVSF